VTTVTLGYSAGLLAAALAHLWLFGQMLGIRVREPGLYRSIARMTYGVVCFGLLFSIVGTILGGVWANYSWGRFWGWDPKENGALLIVLWELLMLHARLGGYVRDFGFALLAIFGGVVVAFSWWGVNLLGVGLHSYGFTSGVQTSLTVFYVIEALVLIGAGAWWLGRRASASASASPGAEA
jgi:ABC-type transport system involved in cytochrome c biogenesis permease subunit